MIKARQKIRAEIVGIVQDIQGDLKLILQHALHLDYAALRGIRAATMKRFDIITTLYAQLATLDTDTRIKPELPTIH